MAEDVPLTSAADLAERIRTGDLSPGTAVDAYLDRIGERNVFPREEF